METIIAALLSATASIVVCNINARAQHNKTMSELDKRDELQAYRIEQLEKKMDKHNNFIERVYALEKEEAVIEEEIKVVNHRIGDLEAFHK